MTPSSSRRTNDKHRVTYSGSVEELDVNRRSNRGRENSMGDDPTKVNTLGEQEWQRFPELLSISENIFFTILHQFNDIILIF